MDVVIIFCMFFFFKQKTAYEMRISDWSSDVCSSDLVSTDAQDLRRQDAIVGEAKAAGYYVAAVYREKASGARAYRPELLRMIADLQPGEVVIAEKIDRISRLPLTEAEQLVETIRARGARLAIPGVVDLSDLAADADGIAPILLESVQALPLKIHINIAHDDYTDSREGQR